MNSIIIDRIKESASIVDVIGDFYELKKKGITYQCLCPFHEDKHLGSFVINPRKNTYTCYSCGEHGDSIAFLMKHENINYLDALRWLAYKYSIETGEDDDTKRYKDIKPAKPHRQSAPLPMLSLPMTMVYARRDTRDNVLANFIRSLGWDNVQRERVEIMLRNYLIGTSRQGHTIFWQVDDEGVVHTGKLMLYKADGHRDKVSQGNFAWIHAKLVAAHKLDPNKADMRQCLFGLHLLHFAQPNCVNIVESEKTALICAIAFGNMHDSIWLASGGKTNLTREKLKPIIDAGYYIRLYPDADGEEEWQQIANTIGYDKLHVDTDMMHAYWRQEDGKKADLADIIIRMIQHQDAQRTVRALIELADQRRGLQILDDIILEHPCLQSLVDKMHLELVINKEDTEE